jgi:hypothetical protein
MEYNLKKNGRQPAFFFFNPTKKTTSKKWKTTLKEKRKTNFKKKINQNQPNWL